MTTASVLRHGSANAAGRRKVRLQAIATFATLYLFVGTCGTYSLRPEAMKETFGASEVNQRRESQDWRDERTRQEGKLARFLVGLTRVSLRLWSLSAPMFITLSGFSFSVWSGYLGMIRMGLLYILP